mmetsp:Transcript_6517/g.16193  ORF Transcript_6517/g.16193 Transcript_6517/m.16193 type:complete len:231 (+) Transcript_6517:1076-1768(+)
MPQRASISVQGGARVTTLVNAAFGLPSHEACHRSSKHSQSKSSVNCEASPTTASWRDCGACMPDAASMSWSTAKPRLTCRSRSSCLPKSAATPAGLDACLGSSMSFNCSLTFDRCRAPPKCANAAPRPLISELQSRQFAGNGELGLDPCWRLTSFAFRPMSCTSALIASVTASMADSCPCTMTAASSFASGLGTCNVTPNFACKAFSVSPPFPMILPHAHAGTSRRTLRP